MPHVKQKNGKQRVTDMLGHSLYLFQSQSIDNMQFPGCYFSQSLELEEKLCMFLHIHITF